MTLGEKIWVRLSAMKSLYLPATLVAACLSLKCLAKPVEKTGDPFLRAAPSDATVASGGSSEAQQQSGSMAELLSPYAVFEVYGVDSEDAAVLMREGKTSEVIYEAVRQLELRGKAGLERVLAQTLRAGTRGRMESVEMVSVPGKMEKKDGKWRAEFAEAKKLGVVVGWSPEESADGSSVEVYLTMNRSQFSEKEARPDGSPHKVDLDYRLETPDSLENQMRLKVSQPALLDGHLTAGSGRRVEMIFAILRSEFVGAESGGRQRLETALGRSEVAADNSQAGSAGVDRGMVEEKLQKQVLPSLQFKDVSLKQAIEHLGKVSGLKIEVSVEASGGVDSDLPITLNLANVPLGAALRYVTNLANASYAVEADGIKIFRHSPGVFLAKAYSVQRPTITKWAKRLGVDQGDIRQVLMSLGVGFEPGCTASYAPEKELLVVRNTAENLELIEQLLEETPAVDPGSVRLDFMIYSMEPSEARRVLSARGTCGSIWREVEECVALKKAVFEKATSVRAANGQRAVVREPVIVDPAVLAQASRDGSVEINEVQNAHEMPELGFLLDVETLTRKAEVPESLGMTLSLSLREPRGVFPLGKGLPSVGVQQIRRLVGEQLIQVGAPTLVGTFNLPDQTGLGHSAAQRKTSLVFVRATRENQ